MAAGITRAVGLELHEVGRGDLYRLPAVLSHNRDRLSRVGVPAFGLNHPFAGHRPHLPSAAAVRVREHQHVDRAKNEVLRHDRPDEFEFRHGAVGTPQQPCGRARSVSLPVRLIVPLVHVERELRDARGQEIDYGLQVVLGLVQL